jgi:demethylmenaquinone methyltransferase/2-methoxy-6-polyprenyl-1,4-benzoquinol methylase
MDEAQAARAVQQMFDSIAPRYDLLNHVLSASVDRLWWWQTARKFQAILADPDAAVLDVCCGTGDMTMALLKRRPRGAADSCGGFRARDVEPRRNENSAARGRMEPACAVALEADALHLPLRPPRSILIVTAFGFRNLANYEPACASLRAC